MSELIQWPRAKYWDRAWNPVIGCRAVSPACENCYAKAWAERFGQSFEPHASGRTKPPCKGIVFCGNMTDLFGPWTYGTACLPEFMIREALKRGATYLWLTKRARRMCEAVEHTLDWEGELSCLDCHYFGFTAENQEWFDKRYEEFGAMPTGVKTWYSLEPLLGPIQLRLNPKLRPLLPEWVVVGCESGPKRRPCKVEWVEKIVEECMAAGVPVFVKQLDIGGRCVTDIGKFPEHLMVRQVPWAKEGGR